MALPFDPASMVHNYPERQGQNEYINLASKINYDGSNIAFVFYENQIRKLMEESLFGERRTRYFLKFFKKEKLF